MLFLSFWQQFFICYNHLILFIWFLEWFLGKQYLVSNIAKNRLILELRFYGCCYPCYVSYYNLSLYLTFSATLTAAASGKENNTWILPTILTTCSSWGGVTWIRSGVDKYICFILVPQLLFKLGYDLGHL